MTTWLTTLATTATAATVAGSIRIAIRHVVWLLGLRRVLRDATPAERPAILRAYATCPPAIAPHRTATPGLSQRRPRTPSRLQPSPTSTELGPSP
jgi:hypothetical protein